MAVFSDILGAGKFGGTPKIPAAFGRYSSQATPQGTLPKPPKSIDLRNLADNLVSRHGNCYRVTAEIGTTCLPHLSAINSLRNQACAWFAPEIRLGCSPETAGAHSRTGLPGPEREERPGPGYQPRVKGASNSSAARCSSLFGLVGWFFARICGFARNGVAGLIPRLRLAPPKVAESK